MTRQIEFANLELGNFVGDEKIYCIVEFIDACRERPTYRSNRALQ